MAPTTDYYERQRLKAEQLSHELAIAEAELHPLSLPYDAKGLALYERRNRLKRELERARYVGD